MADGTTSNVIQQIPKSKVVEDQLTRNLCERRMLRRLLQLARDKEQQDRKQETALARVDLVVRKPRHTRFLACERGDGRSAV